MQISDKFEERFSEYLLGMSDHERQIFYAEAGMALTKSDSGDDNEFGAPYTITIENGKIRIDVEKSAKVQTAYTVYIDTSATPHEMHANCAETQKPLALLPQCLQCRIDENLVVYKTA